MRPSWSSFERLLIEPGSSRKPKGARLGREAESHRQRLGRFKAPSRNEQSNNDRNTPPNVDGKRSWRLNESKRRTEPKIIRKSP